MNVIHWVFVCVLYTGCHEECTELKREWFWTSRGNACSKICGFRSFFNRKRLISIVLTSYYLCYFTCILLLLLFWNSKGFIPLFCNNFITKHWLYKKLGILYKYWCLSTKHQCFVIKLCTIGDERCLGYRVRS